MLNSEPAKKRWRVVITFGTGHRTVLKRTGAMIERVCLLNRELNLLVSGAIFMATSYELPLDRKSAVT